MLTLQFVCVFVCVCVYMGAHMCIWVCVVHVFKFENKILKFHKIYEDVTPIH